MESVGERHLSLLSFRNGDQGSFQAVEVAERPDRLFPCRRRVKALPDQRVNPFVEVEVQLIVHIGADTGTPEPEIPAPERFPVPAHASRGAEVAESTVATARAKSAQREALALSAARPLGVSL